MKPVPVFSHAVPGLALSPWVRAELSAEDEAELAAIAVAKGVTVGIVKRSRDHRYLARIRDGGQAIGRTPYGAALAVLGSLGKVED